MLKKYFLILNVVLIVIALIIIVDISLSSARAGKILVPKPPLLPPGKEEVKKEPKPYEHYSIIVERNLFTGREGAFPEEGLLETLPGAVLNLKLKGTIVVEGLESLCIIEDSTTKKEEVYKRGGLVGENEIVKIERDHVILRTSAGLVSLVIYGESPLPGMASDTSRLVEKVASNRWSLSRSELTSVISNPNQFLGVEVNLYKEAGQVKGFRLKDVKSGSLAKSLGVRSGDIIRKVEGQELDGGVPKALQIYQEMKDKPVISVEVERDGRPITLTYEIRD